MLSSFQATISLSTDDIDNRLETSKDVCKYGDTVSTISQSLLLTYLPRTNQKMVRVRNEKKKFLVKEKKIWIAKKEKCTHFHQIPVH